MLILYDDSIHAGKLAYAVCEGCGIGYVLKLSVYAGYDRSGVGSALVEVLVKAFPELTWYTSWQQPTAVTWWERMAVRSGQPMMERERCDHQHAATRTVDGVLGSFSVEGRG